jgi:hypothetical protein
MNIINLLFRGIAILLMVNLYLDVMILA